MRRCAPAGNPQESPRDTQMSKFWGATVTSLGSAYRKVHTRRQSPGRASMEQLFVAVWDSDVMGHFRCSCRFLSEVPACARSKPRAILRARPSKKENAGPESKDRTTSAEHSETNKARWRPSAVRFKICRARPKACRRRMKSPPFQSG